MPAVLNASNEIAVAAFLDGYIGFQRISEIVDHCLQEAPNGDGRSLAGIRDVDSRTRQIAARACGMEYPHTAETALVKESH